MENIEPSSAEDGIYQYFNFRNLFNNKAWYIAHGYIEISITVSGDSYIKALKYCCHRGHSSRCHGCWCPLQVISSQAIDSNTRRALSAYLLLLYVVIIVLVILAGADVPVVEGPSVTIQSLEDCVDLLWGHTSTSAVDWGKHTDSLTTLKGTIIEISWKFSSLCLWFKPLTCGDRVNSVQLGQYHGCWCPGSLRRQDISSHHIDSIEYVCPYLTWGRIQSTCVISTWSNDIKCKCLFL